MHGKPIVMTIDELLHLLTWKLRYQNISKISGSSRDEAFNQIGTDINVAISLLQQEESSKTDTNQPNASKSLSVMALQMNVTNTRILREFIEIAIYVISDERNTRTNKHAAVRLLHCATNKSSKIFEGELDKIHFSMSVCSHILDLLADSLQQSEDNSSIPIVVDILQIIFDMNINNGDDMHPQFTRYKPLSKDWSCFIKRVIPPLLQRVQGEAANSDEESYAIEALQLVQMILAVFQNLQRSQLNKKKVFLYLTKSEDQFIWHLIAYRQILHQISGSDVFEQRKSKILHVLEGIVLEGLLDDVHISEFEGSFAYSKCWGRGQRSQSKNEKDASEESDPKFRVKMINYPRHMFDTLLQYITEKGGKVSEAISYDWVQSIAAFLSFLILHYAERLRRIAKLKFDDASRNLILQAVDGRPHKKRRANHVLASQSTQYSPFGFWAELCGIIITAYNRSKSDEGALTIQAQLFAAVFQSLSEADIYRMTEDTEDKISYLRLQKIVCTIIDLASSDKLIMQNKDCGSCICLVIAHAVRSSPSVISSLQDAVRLCGTAKNDWQESTDPDLVFDSIIAIRELFKAYNSMRQLEKFWDAVIQASSHAIEPTATHLLNAFSHPETEALLTKSFYLLPPGQLSEMWRYFTNAFNNACRTSNAPLTTLIGFIFGKFMQQVQLKPDNRKLVGQLAIETFDSFKESLQTSIGAKLLSSSTSCALNTLAVLGEMFMSVSGLTIDSLDDKLDEIPSSNGDFAADMIRVLESIKDNDPSSKGCLKLCMCWLRKQKTTFGFMDTHRKLGNAIASLLFKHGEYWRCVIYYIEDFTAILSHDTCVQFAVQFLTARVLTYIDRKYSIVTSRILEDASFYELPVFQKAIIQAAGLLAKELLTLDGSKSNVPLRSIFSTNENWTQAIKSLYHFIAQLPREYAAIVVNDADSKSLLTTSMSLQMKLSESNQESSMEAWMTVTGWLASELKRLSIVKSVGVIEISALHPLNDIWSAITEFVQSTFLYIANMPTNFTVLDKCTPILNDIIAFYAYCAWWKDKTQPRKALQQKLKTLLAERISVTHLALFVDAIASSRPMSVPSQIQCTATVPSVESMIETEFIQQCVLRFQPVFHESQAGIISLNSLSVFYAAIKYWLGSLGSNCEAITRLQLSIEKSIESCSENAIRSTMTLLLRDPSPQSPAYKLFLIVCEHYYIFYQFAKVKGFGRLLATALVLLQRATGDTLGAYQQSIVLLLQRAEMEEFQLFMHTVTKELHCIDMRRSTAAMNALKAVLLQLKNDKGAQKMSSCYRTEISQHKLRIAQQCSSIIKQCLQKSYQELLRSETVELRALQDAVQLFSLMFCTPELFAWRYSEIRFALVGFQSIHLLAMEMEDTAFISASTLSPIDHIWTHSYHLSLRILRHIFKSLSTCIPQIKLAINSLQRVLIHCAKNFVTDADIEKSEPVLLRWATNLSRLYGYVKLHNVAFRKHVIYLIIEHVLAFSSPQNTSFSSNQLSLWLSVQQKVELGVFSLLDLCTNFDKEQLYAAIDTTGKSYLKKLNAQYDSNHRFCGKI